MSKNESIGKKMDRKGESAEGKRGKENVWREKKIKWDEVS